ncbi:hypothetical protein BDV95DRAFT_179495 [Massariosphaeria phaeospora]|uniref:F-box domain-containing protein n=1 Tax=Massariosphaeria phaeospora TaxID=100035 RepID=A0A7C8M3L4_9PLEO|nr:hypothetical protein BDV95DRAFT_179495 [Massariosphaeria phaeospora]
MSLLQLPTDTLIQIFDYVGSAYFRSDLARLTVSKQWSGFARTACFQDFHVTPNTLQRLLSSPYVEPSLALVKDSVETLVLDLKGFEDWDSARDVSFWNSAYGRAVRAAWTTELNTHLLSLATAIKQSRKLRTLRIRATSELHPLLRRLERRNYLFLSTIRSFCSASSNLTSLTERRDMVKRVGGVALDVRGPTKLDEEEGVGVFRCGASGAGCPHELKPQKNERRKNFSPLPRARYPDAASSANCSAAYFSNTPIRLLNSISTLYSSSACRLSGVVLSLNRLPHTRAHLHRVRIVRGPESWHYPRHDVYRCI